MRVLLITDNHTLTGAGGAEHYFFELKSRLQKVPEMEVYSLGFGPSQTSGDDYHVLPATRSKTAKLIWQIVFNPFMYFKIRRQIKKFRPDVVHIHNIKQYTSSLLAAIKPYPVIHTVHDYGMVCPIAHNIHKDQLPCPSGLRLNCFWKHQIKYNVFIYLGMALALLKTRHSLQKVVKQFFAPSPLLVEYLQLNGFNYVRYIAPFKKETEPVILGEHVNLNPFHFLYAGNLGTHKGVHLLLEEFALAYQRNPHLTLTIAGAGPEEGRMRTKIKKLGLEKQIVFTGWLQDLAYHYRKCAAVIFPSLWLEAFGLIITEAMSHARPVIGSDRGSPPWLIDHQKTGLIFNPLKQGDLAEKILLLAGNIELITALGTNGHQKLQGLIDNEKIVQQIISQYQKAAAQS